MPHSVFSSLERQLSHIREILILNDDLRARVEKREITTSSALDEHYWRQYDYCAAVIRLYASFERFVIDLVQKWTDWHATNGLSLIPKSAKVLKHYRYGVGEILKRSTDPRFSKVNLAPLVEGLALLQQEKATPLSPYALFATASNLRFDDVARVLDAVEITQAREWLGSFSPLVAHFQDANATPDSFLKELVERRNEAAHGNELPEDMLSTSLLVSATRSISAFASALTELVSMKMVLAASDTLPGGAELGEVTKVYPRANAMLLKATGNSLSVNTAVWVASPSRCYLEQINSIQIDGRPVDNYAPQPSEEIGIQLSRLTTEGSRLLLAHAIPWLPRPNSVSSPTA